MTAVLKQAVCELRQCKQAQTGRWCLLRGRVSTGDGVVNRMPRAISSDSRQSEASLEPTMAWSMPRAERSTSVKDCRASARARVSVAV